MSPPLIVGAGPVGTAAALFLARHGQPTRLIDQALEPTRNSKALAVNPRTLEILEHVDLTSHLLEMGKRIRGVRIWNRGQPLAQLRIDKLDHKYPFMLALSQATTERILREALTKLGGTVERGARLVACRQIGNEVEADIEHVGDGKKETVRVPWLLGADGAHSVARHQIGTGFVGNSFERVWYLLDVPMHSPADADHAHVAFLDDGFLFFIRVIDDIRNEPAPPIWRVLGNVADPLDRLVGLSLATPAGPPEWTSQFHIAHRMVEQMQLGSVYLAGDAAHLHSPVGARGMNLGIEDAWIFSELVRSGQMSRYTTLRHPVDRAVVKRVERITRVARGESVLARCIRGLAFRVLPRIPFLYKQFLKTATGLDHALTL